ncbi:MAG: hypothetical protein ABI467_24000 [Kofleriaceae bacterium]
MLLLIAGCSSKKSNDQGLPPAQEWSANQAAAQPPAGATAPNAGGDQALPPPTVVDENGQDPHAALRGLPGAEGAEGANPHTGPAGMDTSTMGALAPDPNRPIDPSHHIRGFIKVHPKAADRAKIGGAIFVIVKQADGAGQPTGTPLAVDKLTWTGKDLPFELTEGQAMIKGTQLTGDVVILARYDQDGDAISKQPGDITGQVRVKVPAENVNLFLDTVLP